MPGIRYVVDTGTRPHLPLLAAAQGAAAADREGLAGQREPARRALRPRRRRHLHPALRRGRLRRPPRVHRPGDPAHQPGVGDPADDRAGPGRPRGVPVRRAAGPARRRRRPRAAPGARRAGARAPDADRGRPRARRRCRSTRGWAACSSRPTGPAACARCWSSPRRCRSRTRASARPSSARPPTRKHARFAATRRDGSDFLAFLNLWQLRAGAARGAVRQPVPPAAARGVPALPAHPRVAGPARPAARGRPQRRHDAQRRPTPTRTGSTSPCSPACSARSACSEARDAAEFLGARGAKFMIFPGSPLAEEAAALGDGRRAGGDLPAVGPHRRADPAGVDRAAGRAPGQAHLLGAALVAQARRRRRHRAGDAVRHPDRGRPQRRPRPDRPRAGPRAVHPPRAGRGRLGHPAPRSSTPTARCSTTSRSWRHRARRRDLVVDEDTLFAFYDARIPAEVVSGRHFDTLVEARARAGSPDLLDFTAEMLTHRAGRRGRPRRLPGPRRGRRAHAAAVVRVRAGPARPTGSPSTCRSPRCTRSTPRRSPGRCPGCARSWSPR